MYKAQFEEKKSDLIYRVSCNPFDSILSEIKSVSLVY